LIKDARVFYVLGANNKKIHTRIALTLLWLCERAREAREREKEERNERQRA